MEIHAIVDAALASGLGSAAAVSVGDGGREVLRVVRGHAHVDGPAIDERAVFDVASLTKPMATAAIAMALVADDRVRLDDLVRRWLPDAATEGRVFELLSHTAGCAAHVEFFRALRATPIDPYAALVALAAHHPAGPSGQAAVYSDLGYLQAGALVEAVAGRALPDAFAEFVAGPLGLADTRYGPIDRAIAIATERDADRGLVWGRVHDENAYYGGGACGHAGLFSTIGDVATFAAAMCDALNGTPRGRLAPDVVARFVTTAGAPGASWRLGWDTPSTTPGISHAGDRWPRAHAIGHLGFTGVSIWLDPPRRRWSILLTNRVHPTRGGDTAERIKALRRAVNDAAIDLTDR